MIKILIMLFLTCNFAFVFGQNKNNIPKYFADPIYLDSSSVVLLPVCYEQQYGINADELWNDHYANILFYDSKTDSVKKLFNEDTFIKYLPYPYPINLLHNSAYSSKWIFYLVKSTDYNNNGRIDAYDPNVLYVSDKNGNGLRALTPKNENAISIHIFDKQGFALIKMEPDSKGNKKFKSRDSESIYYVRLDLNILKFERKIDKKQ